MKHVNSRAETLKFEQNEMSNLLVFSSGQSRSNGWTTFANLPIEFNFHPNGRDSAEQGQCRWSATLNPWQSEIRQIKLQVWFSPLWNQCRCK